MTMTFFSEEKKSFLHSPGDVLVDISGGGSDVHFLTVSVHFGAVLLIAFSVVSHLTFSVVIGGGATLHCVGGGGGGRGLGGGLGQGRG